MGFDIIEINLVLFISGRIQVVKSKVQKRSQHWGPEILVLDTLIGKSFGHTFVSMIEFYYFLFTNMGDV